MAITRLGPNQDITAAKIAGQINFKNLIINGDMSIAQRGTQTGVTTNTYGSPDRWLTALTTLGTWTISQDTDVPTGQGFANSLKLDCTTADASPAAGDRIFLTQRLEGQMLQSLKKGTSNAESTTVSFWVKSNVTGTYILELFDNDNTRQVSKTYTIDSASTWEKKTITFDGDTTGTLDNDNNASLYVQWWLGAGTNWTSGTASGSWATNTNANRAAGLTANIGSDTANNFWITGVQLEVGTSASDFEFLPKDINLQRCMRYYQIYSYMGNPGSEVGYSLPIRQSSAGNRQWMITTTLPVPIRSTSPTMSWDAARSGNAGGAYDGSWLYETGSAGNKWVAPQNFFMYANYGGSPVSSASYLSENLGTITSVITDNVNFTSGETVTFSSRLIVDAEL